VTDCDAIRGFTNKDKECSNGGPDDDLDEPSGHGAGVNFTNILCAAFTSLDPKCAKRQSSHQCLFALFGPKHVKAAYKMLVKLTPGAGAVDLRGVEAALEE